VTDAGRSEPVLPAGVELVRTTSEFTETTVPAGLLRAHRVAAGVWGRLAVSGGTVAFAFDDADREDADHEHADQERLVAAGEHQVIPPERPHHVRVVGPVRFVVEFHAALVGEHPA
jgi:tellurite resistance-related uncharacterized protein